VGELVEGNGEKRCADDPPSCPVPGEVIAEKAAPEVRDPEGEEACAGPREQIAGGEDERRERCSSSRHAGIERHRRRDGREHHRGHHHDPHAEEPAEGSEIGSGPLVHAAHPVYCEPPREGGESKEQSDEAEPGTRRGERRRQPRGSGATLVR
jgi:hypothetical protein